MKHRSTALFALFVAVIMGALTLLGGQQAKPPASAAAAPATNPAFEKIKSLAGEWEGKASKGPGGTASFRVVSAGSAVLGSMSEPSGAEMITVFHLDGDRLMATHYCGAKNQPRFVAEPSSDPNKIVFKFKDITNLASPQAGYMQGVTFTFADPDHHTEIWSWTEGGKQGSETFQFTRRKYHTKGR